MSDYFYFKEFSISQKGASLKVGTDAMLLGSFIKEQKAKRVLDIGTGTGVIALMFAQRHPHSKIEAIELDEINAELAELNFKQSPFNKQIQLLRGDFFDFQFTSKFDLIFSNPPFFIDSLDSEDSRKSNSRHFSKDHLKNFISIVVDLLREEGVFYLIIPFENAEIWYHTIQYHLFIHDEIIVFGKPEKAKRIILKCSRNKKDKAKSSFIIRNSEGNYTNEYVKLTKDFHGVPIRLDAESER